MTPSGERGPDKTTTAATRFEVRVHLTQLRGLSQSPIVKNAASLFGSTIVNGALGFVFWLVAARLLLPRDVGTASAVQSATQFVAYVCIFGLGTLAIAELAEDRSSARRLIATTSVVSFVSGVVVGAGVGALMSAFSGALRPGLASPLQLVAFALLCGMTTLALLLDDACIGLLRGDIQLRRNAVFASSKLVLLVVLALVWKATGGTELIVAWLLGIVISLAIAYRAIHHVTETGSWRHDLRGLFHKRDLMYRHHWLNVSILAPRQILPVIVAAVVSPSANAGFYTASMVVGFVNVIPSHLSTALFALKPGDEEALRDEARGTMRICIVVSALSAPFFILTSRFILEIFRHSYVSAAPAMAILGLTTFPSAIKAHYVAIARVRKQMGVAAVRTTITACAEVACASAGAVLYGVTGVALGLLFAYLCEVFYLGSTVFQVIRGPKANHRSA